MDGPPDKKNRRKKKETLPQTPYESKVKTQTPMPAVPVLAEVLAAQRPPVALGYPA